MRPFATLLVVETNPISAFLYQRALQRFAGAQQVLVAPTPRQALALLAAADQEEEPPFPELLVVGMRPVERHVPIVLLVLPGAHEFGNGDLAPLQRVPLAGVVEAPLTSEKARQLLALHPQHQGSENKFGVATAVSHES